MIKVGDIVVPREETRTSLNTGCSSYDFAILCSVIPFIMVSERGDMKWIMENPSNYRSLGTASEEIRKFAFDRYEKDYKYRPIVPENILPTNLIFEAGWRTAAAWAHRDDLIADIGSSAYRNDMIRALKNI